MYIKRTLQERLRSASEWFRVVMVTGPRQVGKTSLMKHVMEPGRNYVTLDDLQARQLAQSDPLQFLQIYKAPLLIDEVQYAPQLFPYIKMIVDNDQTNGQYWLTGSQQFRLMKNVTESLAGRVALLDLQGLSQGEKAGDPTRGAFVPSHTITDTRVSKETDVNQIYAQILEGSFPAVFGKESSFRRDFYSSYVRTYIERDVRDISKVIHEHDFVTFLKVAAARTGQLLNYSDVARDVGVSVMTIKAWISILETCGLIYLLQPFYRNLTKRLTKTPKLYFLDTGLVCHLCGFTTMESVRDGIMDGALLETYAVSEILKSYWHNGETPHLTFYRDTDKREIDLIIEQQLIHPIEIKKTASPTQAHTKNFAVLEQLGVQVGTGAIVCLYPTASAISRQIRIVPLGLI